MKDHEDRERSWTRLRREMDGGGPRMKLAGRLGGRLLI
jgi:hypothetical protein